MRREIRARLSDKNEAAAGSEGFWSLEELVQDAPLKAGEIYRRVPPSLPYKSST